MSTLSTILPPTPEQLRQVKEAISIAERPIKELLFAYFALFENSGGPRYKKYRDVAENIRNFSELPAAFIDSETLYYLPEASAQTAPVEEVMVSETSEHRIWEKWELRVVVVPHDVQWDESRAIANLPPLEAVRIRTAIGQILQMTQVSWNVITKRYPVTSELQLLPQVDNLTLSLHDPSTVSKSDHLKVRLGLNIKVKDKIERPST